MNGLITEFSVKNRCRAWVTTWKGQNIQDGCLLSFWQGSLKLHSKAHRWQTNIQTENIWRKLVCAQSSKCNSLQFEPTSQRVLFFALLFWSVQSAHIVCAMRCPKINFPRMNWTAFCFQFRHRYNIPSWCEHLASNTLLQTCSKPVETNRQMWMHMKRSLTFSERRLEWMNSLMMAGV